jgi:hypothetical protein
MFTAAELLECPVNPTELLKLFWRLLRGGPCSDLMPFAVPSPNIASQPNYKSSYGPEITKVQSVHISLMII